MIFVVLGTQDKPFERLVRAVDAAVAEGIIQDRVVIQAGKTKYESERLEIREIIPIDEFNQLIRDATAVICHAGYGILSTALEYGKKVICAARLAEYGEHQNNHQCDILDYYEKKGYVIALRDFSKFNAVYRSLASFTPKKYSVSFEKLQNFLSEWIEKQDKQGK